MTQYTNIKLNEMTDMLREEKGWKWDLQNNEYTATFYIPSLRHINACIRVYTSIRVDRGTAYGCGKDAIRVVCLWTTREGMERPYLPKPSRVYRIETWKENLEKRVREVIGEAKEKNAAFQNRKRVEV